MKGIFWNANGFRDPAKHRFVSDLTKQHNLSFIAISETCRRDFTDPFLKNLSAGKNFLWHVKEPNGRSGGILMGIDLQVFDIGAIEDGDFFVKFHLITKGDNFKWALVCVYGPAQEDRKVRFLTGLANLGARERLPILIGGDFNILRNPKEKNKPNFNPRWPFLFNAVIEGRNLRELDITGRQFT
jgi:exonuclease III